MEKLHTKLAADFYDEIIKLHHQEFNYKRLQFKSWLDAIVSELDSGDIILDIGCGNGRVVKHFIDRGFRCVGVDISEKMLELARKHVPKGKFYRKDFTKLMFKPNSFDAVVSTFALNHIPKSEFKKVMKSCRIFLKKDGLLVLGMVKGNDEGLFDGFYGKKMTLYGAGYTKKELLGILRPIGFEILKSEITHFKGKHFEEDDIYIIARKKK